ncbi:hypothetical protein QQF64_015334 [Cirrhinus molitorella]|uniref:Uncharacterized protein n=1 Tax=Cirrhinus molitorella TaxID=172907 RepID=A0ABR3NUZ1_9TELE
MQHASKAEFSRNYPKLSEAVHGMSRQRFRRQAHRLEEVPRHICLPCTKLQPKKHIRLSVDDIKYYR